MSPPNLLPKSKITIFLEPFRGEDVQQSTKLKYKEKQTPVKRNVMQGLVYLKEASPNTSQKGEFSYRF